MSCNIKLPQEIDNLILDYKHQLLYSKVMDDLKHVFSYCNSCTLKKVNYKNLPTKKNIYCNECNEFICDDCYYQYPRDICFLCQETHNYYDEYSLNEAFELQPNVYTIEELIELHQQMVD